MSHPGSAGDRPITQSQVLEELVADAASGNRRAQEILLSQFWAIIEQAGVIKYEFGQLVHAYRHACQMLRYEVAVGVQQKLTSDEASCDRCEPDTELYLN